MRRTHRVPVRRDDNGGGKGGFWLTRDHFPQIVRPLVDRYGPERVWSVGLEVLQYPPTWIAKWVGEMDVLTKALELNH
jgi:hypothetical protein